MPDGSRVALGYSDKADVLILSGTTLKRSFKADTTGVPHVGFGAVGWSDDGKFLFAGGDWSKDNTYWVRRWSSGGQGPFMDVPSGSMEIRQILGLKEHRKLLASQLSLIRTDAESLWSIGFGALRLNSGRAPLRISGNGDRAQVESWDPSHAYRFTLRQRLIDIDPPADVSMLAPTTRAPKLSVTNWDSPPASARPALNGTPLKLDPYEISRSLAIVPGTDHFVLGTDWALRLFNN